MKPHWLWIGYIVCNVIVLVLQGWRILDNRRARRRRS